MNYHIITKLPNKSTYELYERIVIHKKMPIRIYKFNFIDQITSVLQNQIIGSLILYNI